ncbi:MAG TPA: PEP-CTERM sorting domain-containing protein [Candidatus Sulfopaludibacter sp.]|nr:PEP-CTERM sorting domain-containing protein [Candidatus Sulfopaludibacter sp.]
MRFFAAVPIVLLALGNTASASNVMFGSLSNFDIYNDLTVNAHGFEIDFQGLHASDVIGTFTYSRYGAPAIAESAGVVTVTYASAYSPSTGWAVSTVPTVNPTPTGGHQCVTGPQGNLTPSNGCEHFGVATLGNPLNENYHWLVEGTTAGTLVQAGTAVTLPAPVWNVPPVPQPVVQAVVQAPPEIEPGALFGDAIWVKVFTTESNSNADLNHLVSGDPLVPDSSAETEAEWTLLQSALGGGGPLQELALDNGGQPVLGAAVLRRYEYYKYTGAYDADHEALDQSIDPNTGLPFSLGAPIGAQNVALNLNGAVPEPASLLLFGAGLAGLGIVRRRK